jgi:hypothetical protein
MLHQSKQLELFLYHYKANAAAYAHLFCDT